MMTFDEMKAWSLLTPKPVIQNSVVFWKGLWMHKTTCVALCFAYWMGCRITPQQKKEIFENSVYLFYDMKREGYEFDFDLTTWSPTTIFSYLGPKLYSNKKIFTDIPEWSNPQTLIKDLFANEFNNLGIDVLTDDV